jgi:uncharacterized protein (DUF2345 family)
LTPIAADAEPVGRDGSFDEMFVLKDEEGVPVTRQRYRITAADGRVHEGVTNDAGETARIYTLTPQRLILELV